MKYYLSILLFTLNVSSSFACDADFASCQARGLGALCSVSNKIAEATDDLFECPKWIKDKKNVPECPKGKLKIIPEYYPSSFYFIGGADYDTILDREVVADIIRFAPSGMEPVISGGDYQTEQVLKIIKGEENQKRVRELIYRVGLPNPSGTGRYYRDGAIPAHENGKPTIYINTNDLGGYNSSLAVLRKCGFQIKTGNVNENPSNSEMGGNVMSPVPGICTYTESRDTDQDHFKQFGCNKKNTVLLNASWGGVRHVDEKIMSIPNPNSKKPPPCNFSLVISSYDKTMEVINKQIEKGKGNKLFFELEPFSRDGIPAKGPYSSWFGKWSKIPPFKDICKRFKEQPLKEFFSDQELETINEHQRILGSKSRQGKMFSFESDPEDEKEVIVPLDEVESAKEKLKEEGYKYVYVKELVYRTKDESQFPQEEILKRQNYRDQKECHELTYNDVKKVYDDFAQNGASRKKVLDEYVANLKKKMKQTRNICGNGDDLDIIYSPDMIYNSYPNSVNMLVTSQKSVAFPGMMNSELNNELKQQMEKRGLFARSIDDIYKNHLTYPRGHDSSGYAHCLTNNIRICK